MIRGDYGDGNEADVNGPDGNEVEGAEFTSPGYGDTIRGQMRETDARAIAAAVNFLRTHGPALLAALRLREWRPIESAPKDGTPVDLWCGEYQERLVNYSREDRGGGNVFYVPNESGRCVVRSATHWMPLPAPPTADDLARILENER